MKILYDSTVKVKSALPMDRYLINRIGKVRKIETGHFGHVILIGVKFPNIPRIHKFYPEELIIIK